MKNEENLIPEDDYEYEKELAEKEKQAEEKKERDAQEALDRQAQKEKELRAAHEKQLLLDRVELAKLKNGVIEESETIVEEHDEIRKLKGFERVGNFFYHYKLMVIFVAFLVIVTAYMIYDAASRREPDLTVVMIANNALDHRTEELQDLFEQYTDDVNGDGEVYVQVISAPLNPNSSDTLQTSNQAKFIAQLQTADSIMFIIDSNTQQDFKDIMDSTLAEDFPDNEYITTTGFSLNFEFLAEELEYEAMPNDVVLAMRTPIKTLGDSEATMQENYDKDFVVFERVVNALKQKAEETNDPGLSTEPVKLETSSEG